ncbi:hypothetical protein [Nocardioides dilutus]
MTELPRPMLLGYIRADVLTNGSDIAQAEAELRSFVEREELSLGTVYVEQGDPPGVLHSLLTELTRDKAAFGLVIPDLRHLTVVEQLILARHDQGASAIVLPAHFTPRAGGPGVCFPPHARSVFPPLTAPGTPEA